jgi:hypothetical protein
MAYTDRSGERVRIAPPRWRTAPRPPFPAIDRRTAACVAAGAVLVVECAFGLWLAAGHDGTATARSGAVRLAPPGLVHVRSAVPTVAAPAGAWAVTAHPAPSTAATPRSTGLTATYAGSRGTPATHHAVTPPQTAGAPVRTSQPPAATPVTPPVGTPPPPASGPVPNPVETPPPPAGSSGHQDGHGGNAGHGNGNGQGAAEGHGQGKGDSHGNGHGDDQGHGKGLVDGLVETAGSLVRGR